MWPFKKHLEIETLDDSKHKWSVAEASSAAGPMIIRINSTAQDWAKHPSLGIRVGFAVPLKHPNPQGMPEPDESEKLGHVEDAIRDCVKSTGPSVHALTITTGTFKEFVFYIKNGDRVAEIHKKLIEEITSHEVQCTAEHDPRWNVYASFGQ